MTDPGYYPENAIDFGYFIIDKQFKFHAQQSCQALWALKCRKLHRTVTFDCLFDLMLYIHRKQLRSCRDSQLPNHTVPVQASRRQFTRIQCPFFHQ